jgi:hypothetical protein
MRAGELLVREAHENALMLNVNILCTDSGVSNLSIDCCYEFWTSKLMLVPHAALPAKE